MECQRGFERSSITFCLRRFQMCEKKVFAIWMIDISINQCLVITMGEIYIYIIYIIVIIIYIYFYSSNFDFNKTPSVFSFQSTPQFFLPTERSPLFPKVFDPT